MGRVLLVCCAVALLAGCGSSPGVNAPTVAPARTYELTGFAPLHVAHPGPARVTFTIRQPSGGPLTDYKRGAGPHTGIHLIVVKRDLSTIIHKHPPIGADGKISETIVFPSPGPYRVLVDAYPGAKGAPRNFQLHQDVRVAGAYRPQPLPAFTPTQSVDGYHVALQAPKELHAIQPAILTATVTDPAGKPVVFKPWFGALAHAVFFRAGSLDYFHTHVCGPSTPGCTSVLGATTVTGKPAGPGKLHVGVLLPIAGTWRLFLQFRDRGRIVTGPFTLPVK
ncbi:MAG TPA: hypothetical protein VFK62_01860 [Gaiellaceae bacterium]|nr:hypothetical protein [Gaiellaceae bacterium]